MNDFGLRFHHLGLAVSEPGGAFRFLSGLGYRVGTSVFDPLQGINLALCTHPAMPDVEVIWPGDVASLLDRLIHRGHMIYHICYMAADVDRSILAIEAAGLGVVPLGEAKPAVLFGGTKVSFYSVEQFGMIELLHGKPV